MNSSTESTSMLELSQTEANTLLETFDRLLQEEGCKFKHLPETCEQLSDSLWLSSWMRDNVNVELDTTARVEALEALMKLLNECDAGERDVQSITAIADRLRTVNVFFACTS